MVRSLPARRAALTERGDSNNWGGVTGWITNLLTGTKRRSTTVGMHRYLSSGLHQKPHESSIARHLQRNRKNTYRQHFTRCHRHNPTAAQRYPYHLYMLWQSCGSAHRLVKKEPVRTIRTVLTMVSHCSAQHSADDHEDHGTWYQAALPYGDKWLPPGRPE